MNGAVTIAKKGLTITASSITPTYGDAIVDGFERYLDQIPGPKVLCADDPVCRRLAGTRDVVTYGTADDADYRTPWERGDDAALADYELAMIRRSAKNMRAIGLGDKTGD